MKFYHVIRNRVIKSLKKSICLFALIGCHLLSSAQDTLSEREIRNLDDKQRASMLVEDTESLKKIYDPAIIVNAPFNAVTSGREVIFHLVQTGFIKLSAFDIEVEKVMVMDNVAISMGSETVTFDKNSANPNAGKTVKRRYTHVYLKETGAWKLIARHANEICQ